MLRHWPWPEQGVTEKKSGKRKKTDAKLVFILEKANDQFAHEL